VSRIELFEHAAARDVIAWLRLLADPGDSAAVVRALGRAPIELRQVDIARVVQVARKAKLDLIAALAPAIEAPGMPPQARERIERFQALHREAQAAFEALRPRMQGSPRELAAELTAASEAGVLAGEGSSEARAQTLQETVELMREEVLGGAARIAGRLGELRLDTDLDISHGVVRYLELVKLKALKDRPPGQSLAEALADINQRLLAACTPLQREIFQSSPLDRMLLGAEHGESAERAETAPTQGGQALRPALVPGAGEAFARREEPSLLAFIPRRGDGLVLSASDIDTYRSCPLRYKYARVLKVPAPQTLHQRFGIAVHQALERYHAAATGSRSAGSRIGQQSTPEMEAHPPGHAAGSPPIGDRHQNWRPTHPGTQRDLRSASQHTTVGQMLEQFEACWRRGGFGDSPRELELHGKARAALVLYHRRLESHEAEPVWFERSFSFQLGPHHLRGRVDRVDRLADGAYELIDYKTSRPKTAEQLRDDVQLSLYALGARESWQVLAERLSYYYVLDDVKIPVPSTEMDPDWIARVVREVGAAIMAERFEPTPSPATCALCDYRIACPAWER
jgi:DNA helicase II / ATP-dependent DNA helicase PcrA